MQELGLPPRRHPLLPRLPQEGCSGCHFGTTAPPRAAFQLRLHEQNGTLKLVCLWLLSRSGASSLVSTKRIPKTGCCNGKMTTTGDRSVYPEVSARQEKSVLECTCTHTHAHTLLHQITHTPFLNSCFHLFMWPWKWQLLPSAIRTILLPSCLPMR